MRSWLLAIAMCAFTVHADAVSDLSKKVWQHGSQDCAKNQDPPIEVFEFDADTYILRQNKCVHFEAPFIYVLFGEQTVFVQDTGATADPARFPLYDVIQRLIAQRGNTALKVLVTHTHSHSDHTAADAQFRGKPGVTLVEPNAAAVQEHFGFTNWPAGIATIDLGQRTLKVIPAPGHHDEAIVVHDARTGWLLTGDNVYPGRLIVSNWPAYRSSIERLVEFSKTHPVSAVLGTHIEMAASGKLFALGSTFQPDEAPLALTVDDLRQLQASLANTPEPTTITLASFVVSPLGALQRTLGSVLKWLGVR
jgi:hydroxyacylglutathione hydrolase